MPGPALGEALAGPGAASSSFQVRTLLPRLAAALAPAPDDDRVVAAAPAVPLREVVRRFWPLARPFRKPFAAGVALAALLPAVEAAEIWLFKLASVREHVALLLQDAPLFDGTVFDNVTYWRPGATEEEVRDALAQAAADGLADELPGGLESRVGQRGRALSGGQRRRVAMARALLQDAPVLVLDEPSAGLDADATRRLLGPLRRLMRDRATLLITHDLTLAAAADEVVVLEEGRVCGRGAPSLLAEAAA